ncbi:MAG: lamin tail domain-containing protein, partial [Planctomycetes bacterium]|nr:lamin tail domain-containing protein [Planctomycetota bacterium]
WFLSDTNNNYKKFRIPNGTLLGPGEYLFYDETHFNPTGLDLDPENDDPNDFALNGAHGDDVWLLSADSAGNLTRFIDRVEFVAGVNGESFGRWPNGSGTMFPMTERTFGAQNSGPRFGPVIFSELMFHPELPAPESGLDANDLEFIEIFNTSSSAISLMNWEIGKGVGYRFADDASIGAGQSLVILSFNPQFAGNSEKLAGVMAAYNFAPGTVILGGYSGSLDNTGERLRLFRPDVPPTDEPGFIPLLIEDEIRFSPLAPWPTGASASGESLTRRSDEAWSNAPTNWQAATPTPGSTTFSGFVAADLTRNGFVDFQDLTILLANWNQNVTAAEGNLVDPVATPVNFQDLTVLLAEWTGPGPAAAAAPQAAAASVSTADTPPAESRIATNSHFDRLGRRELATARRANRTRRLTSHDTSLQRLQAAAVDRAMEEGSDVTLTRPGSAFSRRRR